MSLRQHVMHGGWSNRGPPSPLGRYCTVSSVERLRLVKLSNRFRGLWNRVFRWCEMWRSRSSTGLRSRLRLSASHQAGHIMSPMTHLWVIWHSYALRSFRNIRSALVTDKFGVYIQLARSGSCNAIYLCGYKQHHDDPEERKHTHTCRRRTRKFITPALNNVSWYRYITVEIGRNENGELIQPSNEGWFRQNEPMFKGYMITQAMPVVPASCAVGYKSGVQMPRHR